MGDDDMAGDAAALARLQSASRLTAARRRLAEAPDRDDVLQAIEEVVANLVGSERLGVFLLEGEALRLARALDIDVRRWSRASLSDAVFARAAAAAGPVVGDGARACAALRSGERLVGFVLLVELLPHKADLDEGDLDVLRLLGAEAGAALGRTE